MKIQKTVELNIQKKGKYIICYDATTLQMVVGTSAVSGNYQIYGIKKEKGRWIVPIETIQKRMEKLERDIQGWENRLSIMKQIMRK